MRRHAERAFDSPTCTRAHVAGPCATVPGALTMCVYVSVVGVVSRGPWACIVASFFCQALEAATRDKALLVQHMASMETELQHKLDLLQSSRHQHLNETLELQSRLDSERLACSTATSQLATMQERFAAQTTQLDHALRELRDATAAFATQRDVDAREVQAQARLSELYQRTTNEERARVTTLQQTIAALEVRCISFLSPVTAWWMLM